MLKHDFYADPTVFDQLKNDAGNWFRARFEKLRPYSWTIGFGLLGLVFLSIAAVVFVVLLQQRLGGDAASVLNQSLAQAVTMMIALLAAQVVLKQALAAWPRQMEMPARLRFVAVYLGFRTPAPPGVAVSEKVRASTHPRPDEPVSEQQATQEFFAGVRAAGVNVTVARSLFAAGMRSADHLRAIGNRRLYRIHGVGPATVRKLRAHFSAQ
ncbi:MAG: hypothetical protein BMS9Abin08_1021 [Gammaproteobacteria bacterium]|nr:MAG: hypothetical protein BMS9Abin08_1021 [Gammaproteobacteria bacterium]